MIERICPECATGNPVEAEQCAACGCPLEAPLVRQSSGPLSRLTPRLPVRWQQAGKAVALGAVALAVEAGAAWLQQRAAQKPAPLARPGRRQSAAYVAQQRVWETFEDGVLRRRVIEQTVWRFPDEP
ncbi:MAG TPA: hypothetical protein VE268_09365 [Herpetosiphonaceae bacterium]|nr:hypothetical protein [Herpetosiphonaceae bacterium]